MEDNLFKDLFVLISKKERKINIDDNPLIKHILGDVEIKDTKLSDISLYHSCIDKGNYTFNIITIPKEIPIKKPDAKHRLDFEMKQFYVIDIAINNNDLYCNMSVDKCENRKEAKKIYLNWKDYINENELNAIFNKLINIITTRQK